MDEILDEIWGSQKLLLDPNFKLTADENELAVMLAVGPKNYDNFMALDAFRRILRANGLRADLFSVQSAQAGILNALKGAKISKDKLTDALAILRDEKIITRENFEILSDFLARISADQSVEQNPKTTGFLREKRGELNEIADKILALGNDGNLAAAVKSAREKFNELNFNVAVAGVVNAGKSTLLNALLDKRVLGASNVPETANLTFLKFAERPSAKINFYDENELRELGVKIPENFKNLTQISVNADEIKNYTSAASELSPAVKSVELYENLNLLKEGICIADTPGIDDAMFLREKISLDYISKCDLVVYLMNAAQSASQKDLDFLEGCFKRAGVAKLAVLLTHADTLSAGELNEATNYVKKAVSARLADLTGGERVEFFAVSAKKYLDGEGGGVEEFRNFLYETLLGENNVKVKLSIKAYENALLNAASKLLASADESLLVLGGSNSDALQNLAELNAQKEKLQNLQNEIKALASEELAKISEVGFDSAFAASLKAAGAKIKDRILNEAAYQKKQKIKRPARVEYILKSGLNDEVTNLARSCRQQIVEALKSCANAIELKFSGFNVGYEPQIFNVGEYMSKAGVNLDLAGAWRSIAGYLESDALPSAVDKALSEFLEDENIKNFISALVRLEKQNFENLLSRALGAKILELKSREERLQNEAKFLSDKNANVASRIEKLAKQKSELISLISELKNV